MKKIFTVLIALSCICTGIYAQSKFVMPDTKNIMSCESYNKTTENWQPLSENEKSSLLAIVAAIEGFRKPACPPGVSCSPVATPITFRIATMDKKELMISFNFNGDIVRISAQDYFDYKIVSPEYKKHTAILIDGYRGRIISRSLPCEYSLCSADDSGTLSGVAQFFYKNTTKWKIIYNANRYRIKNPNKMNCGIKLVIPENKE